MTFLPAHTKWKVQAGCKTRHVHGWNNAPTPARPPPTCTQGKATLLASPPAPQPTCPCTTARHSRTTKSMFGRPMCVDTMVSGIPLYRPAAVKRTQRRSSISAEVGETIHQSCAWSCRMQVWRIAAVEQANTQQMETLWSCTPLQHTRLSALPISSMAGPQ